MEKEPKIIEEVEIVRWIVRVEEFPQGKQHAQLIGISEKGEEITLHPALYMNGEYHDVETDIHCTTKED